MSASYYADAPAAQPLPGYSFAYPLNPRSRSRSLRRSSSTSQSRSANDALVSAPPPDLIHDLLASFGSISIPTEDKHVHPALRTKPGRESSSTPNYRHSFSFSAHRQKLSQDLPSSKRPNLRSSDFRAFNDVASPPIIRTSRTTGSYSRASGQAASLPLATPEDELDVGDDDFLSYSRELSRGHNVPRAMRRGTSDGTLDGDSIDNETIRRYSGDLTFEESKSESPLTAAFVHPKGKTKELDAQLPPRPPRTDAYDSRRQGRIYIAPSVSSGTTSRHSTARSSFNYDSKQSNLGAANYHKRFASFDSTARELSKHPRPSIDSLAPQLLSSGVVVPPRNSSLKRVDSLTLLRRRASVRSPFLKVDEDVIEPKPIESNGTPIVVEPATDDSDVLKRIKELKAAREARTKEYVDMNSDFTTRLDIVPTIPPNLAGDRKAPINLNTVPSLPSSPPMTTLARKQLDEALQQNQHRMSTDATKSVASFAPSSTYSSTPRVSADILPIEFVNFSRDRPRVVRTPSPSKQLEELQEKPLRTNRWSLPQTTLSEASPQAGSTLTSTLRRNLSASRSPPKSSPSRSRLNEAQAFNSESIADAVSTYLQSARFSQTITVPGENRSITFSEVGDPRGHVVFCCVGMGMTRYIMVFYDELATSLNLRLITPDRPGIGESESYPEGSRKPISWPDDISIICNHLQIKDFSLLAHSAGAIYALATALRMPSLINGKVHLLAPWIPPSQMSAPAANGYASDSTAPLTGGMLPKSQRFLRMLPTPFIKLSTSSWVTNAGLTRNRSPRPTKSKSAIDLFRSSSDTSTTGASPRISFGQLRAALTRKGSNSDEPPSTNIDDVVLSSIPDNEIMLAFDGTIPRDSNVTTDADDSLVTPTLPILPRQSDGVVLERQKRYDAALTPAIWELATKNANPAVDLLVCLERQQSIGFRYADVDLTGVAKARGADYLERPSESISSGVTNGSGNSSGVSTPRSRHGTVRRSGTYSRKGTGGRNGIGEIRSANGSVVVLNGIDSVAGSPTTNGKRIPIPASPPTNRIVIHHGSKDQRVPLENVKWLGRTMKGVELRVVDGEGHGLMACAGVMGQVLTEMGRELEGYST